MKTQKISSDRLTCGRRTYHKDNYRNERGEFFTITEINGGRRSSINVSSEDEEAFLAFVRKGSK